MKELTERFYNSVRLGDKPPISYSEIISTARIMDEIFAQISPSRTTDDRRRKTGTDHRLEMVRDVSAPLLTSDV